MNKFGILSVLFFLVSALVYFVSTFLVGDLFSGTVMILVVIVLPIIGLVLAFKSKGKYKIVGIIGNLIILIVAGIIPAVSTLFWHTP